MFYTYRQNNSGGGFEEGPGISVEVIVEADSPDEADTLAESIGIYFDDDYEIDCECCGQRWYHAYDGDPVPSHYGTPIDLDAPMPNSNFSIKWADGPEGFVHYKDGTVKPFWTS